jgi:hypothetical protein
VSKRVPLPVSKAENAYELLGDVIEAVQEEPKRVVMDFYVRTGWELDSFIDRINLRRREKVEGPACGTAACVAGWSVQMARPTTKWASEDYWNVFPTACSVFGISQPEGLEGNVRGAKFDGDYGKDLRRLFFKGFPRRRYGTKEYADHVIARIREFRKLHRKRLLATPIKRRKPQARRVTGRKVRVPLTQ